MSETAKRGIYLCERCGVEYLADGTWSTCTPEFCHKCSGYLSNLYVKVPVDKDGKQTVQ